MITILILLRPNKGKGNLEDPGGLAELTKQWLDFRETKDVTIFKM